MIPFIRSFAELMAITDSRDYQKNIPKDDESYSLTIDSGQRKRYIKSLAIKDIGLPDLPKQIRHRWKYNKKSVSKFFDNLDYNNQIQSSYQLTLLEKENKRTKEDVA